MEWTEIYFKKYAGKTLPQIIFRDADWFFHKYENGDFKNHHAIEARELYRRARSIRVPQKNGQKMVVEYIIHGNRKFGTMRLISDASGVVSLNVSHLIDFYVPRSYAPYDKMGYRNFVSALKTILFGNPSQRMSKEACEEFFNDDSNFNLN